MFAGQTIDGASLSLTITLKAHEPLLPLASAAEQVTVVAPFGKVEPLAGAQLTAPTPEQLSLAAGVVNVTTAEH